MRNWQGNLSSPNQIRKPCNLEDLDSWFREEAKTTYSEVIQSIIYNVQEHIDVFVWWPKRTLLLWEGFYRINKEKVSAL
jgi:hypothetical protein